MAVNSNFTKYGPRFVIEKVKEISAVDMEIVIVEVDSSVGTLDPYTCDHKLRSFTGLLGERQKSRASNFKVESA